MLQRFDIAWLITWPSFSSCYGAMIPPECVHLVWFVSDRKAVVMVDMNLDHLLAATNLRTFFGADSREVLCSLLKYIL